jgi:hypothetical protein
MIQYGLSIGVDRRKESFCRSVATYEIENRIRAYDETNDEYPVKGIVDYYAGRHDTEDLFRVEWEGYSGQDTWEPESGLPSDMVLDFHKRRPSVPVRLV